MFLLQLVSYLCEMILIILIGGFFTIYPNRLVDKYDKRPRKLKVITFLKQAAYRIDIIERIKRIIPSILIGSMTVYFLIPYMLDFPKLILGRYDYAIGYVNDVRRESKSFYEYVNIGGEKIKFFFSSNVEEYKKYEIRYLPNTKRAIFGEQLSDDKLESSRKIGFPLKDVLLFLGIILVFILIVIASPYLQFKLFILACVLFYPLYIYLYIKSGIYYGTWFVLRAEPVSSLVIFFTGSIIGILLYLGEKHKSGEAILTMVYIQVMAILKIIMVIVYFIER